MDTAGPTDCSRMGGAGGTVSGVCVCVPLK